MKWTRLLAFILVLCSLCMVTGCSDQSGDSDTVGNSSDETIVIGCTVPLTGNNQLIGSYYQNGVQMAADEINEAGGILGKQVKIEFVDEGSDPQTAVNACQKLIDQDVVAILGALTSTNCLAMIPSIVESETPYFAFGSNPSITEDGEGWVWQYRVLESTSAEMTAKMFYEDYGVENPAVVRNSSEVAVVGSTSFIDQYAEMGIEIPEEHIFTVTEDETNFSNIISQIMASGCDGLYGSIVNSNQAVPFAQQVYAAGWDKPKSGNAVFVSPEFRSADVTASEGWASVGEWTSSVLDENLPVELPEETIAFATNYEARYDMESASQAAYTYDALYSFKYACEAAGTTEDRAAINEGMKQIDYQGAMNRYYYQGEGMPLTSYILVLENKSGDAVPSAILSTVE